MPQTWLRYAKKDKISAEANAESKPSFPIPSSNNISVGEFCVMGGGNYRLNAINCYKMHRYCEKAEKTGNKNERKLNKNEKYGNKIERKLNKNGKCGNKNDNFLNKVL